MRLTDEGLEDHVILVARLLERYGVELDAQAGDLLIEQSIDGTQTFDLRGTIGMDPSSVPAIVDVRETWVPGESGELERREYVYELIDQGRDFRRAFHLHDAAWFERRFLVVVHEHCERPIGAVDCGHYEGTPIRDPFAGVVALVDAWTADPPDCAQLRCLDRATALRSWPAAPPASSTFAVALRWMTGRLAEWVANASDLCRHNSPYRK